MGRHSPSRKNAHRKLVKKLKIAERDGGWFCCYCGKDLLELTFENFREADGNSDTYPTLEHVDPLAYGGSPRDIDNLKLACRSCNNITYNQPMNDKRTSI